RVVKRLRAATIPRANITTHGYQLSHDLQPVGSGGDVECRVALIYVVPDLFEVVLLCRLTGRAVLGARAHQHRRHGKQPQSGSRVTECDRPYQRHEPRIAGSRHRLIPPQVYIATDGSHRWTQMNTDKNMCVSVADLSSADISVFICGFKR